MSPRCIAIKEKRRLGQYIPDFVLKINDKRNLIEIQLNYDPIIQDGKPSSGFKEALKQVDDWLNWIESNEPEMLPKYTGLIIIGRKKDYLKHEKIIKEILSAETKYPIKLLTYDDLENSIDYILSRLSKTTSE